MTVIQTMAGLESVAPTLYSLRPIGSVAMYNDRASSYAQLYIKQPNIRTVVDFLARNIAQLGLHVFQRVSDTDRQRLTDHPLAQLLGRPNPWTTTYRLIEALVADLGIYHRAYWLKAKTSNGGFGLVRMPPQLVQVVGVLMPQYFVFQLQQGTRIDLDPREVVHFRGYNPDSSIDGLSPLETLRRILAEEHSAGMYREGFWANAARMSGIITRPPTAPEWSLPARNRFRAEWEEMLSGEANSGKTAILEEGMSFAKTSFSSEESQYIEGRKLTREECARAYHIPPPMVGILDHATFSNITEQHLMLYNDTLGPWLNMIQADIELQLLPDFANSRNCYVEFNMAEKLRGSFEQQATSLSAAVGRPYMTANEARARLNLTSLGGDADQLVTPLNVLAGGQASPRDSAPPPKALKAAGDTYDTTQLRERLRHVEVWRAKLKAFFERQRAVIVGKLPKGRKVAASTLWDGARWDRELTDDLLALSTDTAGKFAGDLASALGTDYNPAIMKNWLTKHSELYASGINGRTLERLKRALDSDDPLDDVQTLFDDLGEGAAGRIASTGVTTTANFGAADAAEHSGLKEKTWRVNASNPRQSHARLNGDTVKIQDDFSNGMKWPGDPNGGADEVANCTCSVLFS